MYGHIEICNIYLRHCCQVTVKRYSYPITDLDRPIGPYEFETPRISRQPTHENGNVGSMMHRVWPKKISKRKIFMSPSRIETTTFRLVAQCPKSFPTMCPIHLLQKSIKLHLQPTKWQMAFCDVMVKFGR
jgi:hypothetical protein